MSLDFWYYQSGNFVMHQHHTLKPTFRSTATCVNVEEGRLWSNASILNPSRLLGDPVGSHADGCRRCQPVGAAGSKFSQLWKNKDFRAAVVSRMEGWLLLALTAVVVEPGLAGAPPPVWSQTYAVEGTLSIPYAEIEVKLNLTFLSNFSSCPGAFCCLGRSGCR